MSKKKYTFVANWKMYLDADQALTFAVEHRSSFIDLTETTGHEIILCPSMLEFQQISKLFQHTSIKIGTQDCSGYEKGAYTGQVSVASIKSAGGTYSLVGHSERRLYNGETNEGVAQKVSLLLACHVTPIICIGEDVAAYQEGRTLDVLEKQLALVGEELSKSDHKNSIIYIAYEPVWSIGTGNTPSPKELSVVFNWLYRHTQAFNKGSWRFMYGGSVTENTISRFDGLEHLDGFLIGGASLNFQAFKKIVSYPLVEYLS